MREQEQVRIGQVGHGFIGKAHNYGYTNVGLFFDVKLRPVKRLLCGRSEEVREDARKWGWKEWTHDWREVVGHPDVDVVDICAPSILHHDIAVAAMEAGKHVFCEKPLAMTLEEAREMAAVAERTGVTHTIGFNYRKVPALALSKELIKEGAIGRIFHFRGIYSQDWLVDPDFPLAWRLREEDAGGGASWDLGAHVVDLARYLVGELGEVIGSQTTFIKERPVAKIEKGLTAIAGEEMGAVTVDDATSFLAHFEDGAMGLFEATRYGTGHRNENRVEIYGSEGSLIWEGFPKMNDLLFYSRSDPAHAQGFRRIQLGEGAHPYGDAYYPPGHIIGFGETFVNEVRDFLNAIAEGTPASPNFHDGMKCQEVLVGVDRSIEEERWVALSELA